MTNKKPQYFWLGDFNIPTNGSGFPSSKDQLIRNARDSKSVCEEVSFTDSVDAVLAEGGAVINVDSFFHKIAGPEIDEYLKRKGYGDRLRLNSMDGNYVAIQARRKNA